MYFVHTYFMYVWEINTYICTYIYPHASYTHHGMRVCEICTQVHARHRVRIRGFCPCRVKQLASTKSSLFLLDSRTGSRPTSREEANPPAFSLSILRAGVGQDQLIRMRGIPSRSKRGDRERALGAEARMFYLLAPSASRPAEDGTDCAKDGLSYSVPANACLP